MSDLAAFLTSCLDAEAETARAATEGPWRVGQGGDVLASDDDTRRGSPLRYVTQDSYGDSAVTPADAAHIARQDPQATLDRVEALRAVVAMHDVWSTDDGPGVMTPQRRAGLKHCVTCTEEEERPYPTGYAADWPCPTLRALAWAYRRHPDYDEVAG